MTYRDWRNADPDWGVPTEPPLPGATFGEVLEDLMNRSIIDIGADGGPILTLECTFSSETDSDGRDWSGYV